MFVALIKLPAGQDQADLAPGNFHDIQPELAQAKMHETTSSIGSSNCYC